MGELLRAAPPGLSTLDLSHNSLGTRAGAALAAGLATSPARLSSLDLSWNPLGGGGAAALAWALLGPRTGTSMGRCGGGDNSTH